MSGFSQDEFVEEMLAAGAVGFIARPFAIELLGEAVAAALSRVREDGDREGRR